jgi:hypothetical protein
MPSVIGVTILDVPEEQNIITIEETKEMKLSWNGTPSSINNTTTTFSPAHTDTTRIQRYILACNKQRQKAHQSEDATRNWKPFY